MHTIWMFSGQGTQYYGMGRDLYHSEPIFRDTIERGDTILRPLINESIVDILYRDRVDRFEPFVRLLYSHPAIFLFECAMVDMLREKGHRPDALLGYSLGEFAALYAAGALEFESGLRAVLGIAELLEYCVPRGAMIAVLEAAEYPLRYPHIFEGVAVAGWNFPGNFVISGDVKGVARIRQFLKREDVRYLDLPVSVAFHSPAMNVARIPSIELLSDLTISELRFPITEMGNGVPLQTVTSDHLWNVTCKPVDFAGAIRGLEKNGPHRYIDLGPSGSMATAVKYGLAPTSRSEFLPIASPFGQEAQNVARL